MVILKYLIGVGIENMKKSYKIEQECINFIKNSPINNTIRSFYYEDEIYILYIHFSLKNEDNENNCIYSQGVTTPLYSFLNKKTFRLNFNFFNCKNHEDIIKEFKILFSHEFVHIQQRNGVSKQLIKGKYFPAPGVLSDLDKNKLKNNMQLLLHRLEPREIDGYLAMYKTSLVVNKIKIENYKDGFFWWPYMSQNVSIIDDLKKETENDVNEIWKQLTELDWPKNKIILKLEKENELVMQYWKNKTIKLAYKYAK